jgi:PII-like signaling protein
MKNKELINRLRKIVIEETVDERQNILETIEFVYNLNDNTTLLNELVSIIQYYKSLND